MKNHTLGRITNNAPPELCPKREYTSRKSAKVSAKKQKGKYKLSPYLCSKCGYFHLTGANSEEKEVIRKWKCLDRIEQAEKL